MAKKTRSQEAEAEAEAETMIEKINTSEFAGSGVRRSVTITYYDTIIDALKTIRDQVHAEMEDRGD